MVVGGVLNATLRRVDLRRICINPGNLTKWYQKWWVCCLFEDVSSASNTRNHLGYLFAKFQGGVRILIVHLQNIYGINSCIQRKIRTPQKTLSPSPVFAAASFAPSKKSPWNSKSASPHDPNFARTMNSCLVKLSFVRLRPRCPPSLFQGFEIEKAE